MYAQDQRVSVPYLGTGRGRKSKPRGLDTQEDTMNMTCNPNTAGIVFRIPKQTMC